MQRAFQPSFLRPVVTWTTVVFSTIYLSSLAVAVFGSDQQWSHLKAWLDISLPLGVCGIPLALVYYLRGTAAE